MLEVGLSNKSALNLRVGYNMVKHGDLGKHDDERGGGTGLSIGYRKYLKTDGNGFLYGLRSDLCFNSVDCTNDTPKVTGNTKVTVFQPTATIGYQFGSTNTLMITPTVSIGAEINFSTKGEPVGEGVIALLGDDEGYQF